MIDEESPVIDEGAPIVKIAEQLLGIIERDKPRLERIRDYLDGKHDNPYLPSNADDEYRMLAKRSVSNWMPLVVTTVAQAMYVDGYRPGRISTEETFTETRSTLSPHWDFFMRSRFGARQAQITRGALGYGFDFVVVEDHDGKSRGRALNPLNTTAIFEDPINDDSPLFALTIWRRPAGDRAGLASMWDDKNRYDLRLGSKVRVINSAPHGATENPVTRFAPAVDITGRPIGLVEPTIPLQNRINQSVFDLLVVQTYGSFQVRYATGMAPPVKRDADGEPILDTATGNPIPLPIKLSRQIYSLLPLAARAHRRGSLPFEPPFGGAPWQRRKQYLMCGGASPPD